MPLEAEAPQLDRRTFEELYRLARLRIPRYTPEWTDFNESDPGIALVQLFAWLSETLLYEMNRVPERSYVKFLQLLGMELEPAQPAVAHLTFLARPGAPDVQPIPARTPVGAQPPEGGELLVFETTDGLSLIRTPLAKVLAYDGASFEDVTAGNEHSGAPFRPLGWVPQPGSALYLGFASDPPPVGEPFPQEVRLRFFLPPSEEAAKPQSCADAVTPPAPPVTLVWEYRRASVPDAWRRLNLYEDETAAFTREGYVVLEGPQEIVASSEGGVPELLFWLRCRLAAGTYLGGFAPEIDLVRPNTAPAENVATVRDELVGTSEGVPNQEFRLERRPVQAGSLELYVQLPDQNPDEAERWVEIEDFLASAPDDPHFVLNRTTGQIRFGDQRRGRIPEAGAEIVVRKYRYGGGKAGNVSTGLIATPLTALVGVDEVTNARPAEGGADEEPLEDLKEQAPRVLRHRNRAVTAEDFAALARRAGGVGRATAVALAHPDHRDVVVPGAVTVVVVPERGDTPPLPSSELIRHVCRHLERYRLLTTEVFVKGPEYQAIKVEARVAAEPYAAFDAVARGVAQAVDDFLSPRRWPFGVDLFPTALYSVILGVEGVAAVPTLGITVNGRPRELSDPVRVSPDGLVYGADHEITVEPRTDR